MTTTPGDLTPELVHRLEASAADLHSKEEAVELARDLRDSVIVEAIDRGHLSQRSVARSAGLTQASIVRILAHG